MLIVVSSKNKHTSTTHNSWAHTTTKRQAKSQKKIKELYKQWGNASNTSSNSEKAWVKPAAATTRLICSGGSSSGSRSNILKRRWGHKIIHTNSYKPNTDTKVSQLVIERVGVWARANVAAQLEFVVRQWSGETVSERVYDAYNNNSSDNKHNNPLDTIIKHFYRI